MVVQSYGACKKKKWVERMEFEQASFPPQLTELGWTMLAEVVGSNLRLSILSTTDGSQRKSYPSHSYN